MTDNEPPREVLGNWLGVFEAVAAELRRVVVAG